LSVPADTLMSAVLNEGGVAMGLTAAQRDRACGALLATAAGDALGAGYEFDGPRGPDEPVDMIGGGLGPFQPGEWTDDTSRRFPGGAGQAGSVELVGGRR
jgi:hypothetical protein